MYKNTTDVELFLLVKNDDELAFTEIYRRYWKKLFVIAGHKLRSLEEAEEVVQDIFTALWRRRSTLVLTADLSSYLAVSVKYRIIRTLDRYYNQQRYIDSLVFSEHLDNSTQDTLAFNELCEELAKYVQELPEKCRLVFKLSREAGYSQKQIAEELQISEKTVEAHLGKAFKILRTKLAGFMMTLL
ncbi:RNA polymerase sigma-70 factor [Olivibacter ginsenosidimutans]|uniref:RNA polymerase sigma-70 factor n=1 Tax=Olivibacter ginsenosidimutans TaxID=1176537 RepID=A0ABP9ABA5_9SPHI